MDNNWFSKPGDLEDNNTKVNSSSFLKPAGDLGEKGMNMKSNATITATDIEKKIFGRVLDKTQTGYEDAIARRDAAWKEYDEIDNRISNGTATQEDWERHDEIVKIYQREVSAVNTIKSFLENKSKNSGMSFFQIAGDLDTPKPENSFTFEEKKEELKTPEEIRQWLKTIVSGEKKSNYAFGEGLLATGSGSMFVSIEELQEMVKNGDNIIKAEYFDNMNMVMIEFETFRNISKSR